MVMSREGKDKDGAPLEHGVSVAVEEGDVEGAEDGDAAGAAGAAATLRVAVVRSAWGAEDGMGAGASGEEGLAKQDQQASASGTGWSRMITGFDSEVWLRTGEGFGSAICSLLTSEA
jgi:hypothetical protein